MHLIIDGLVYGRQKFGGINTYLNELLPRLASRWQVQVDLMLPRACPGRPPDEPVRRIHREWLPERTGLSWRLDQHLRSLVARPNAWLRDRRVRARRPCIFQSSYFTRVSAAVAQVAVAYDLNHELIPDAYSPGLGQYLRQTCPEYFRSATRIIAISHKTKRDLVCIYGCKPERIDVIHLAVDRNVFQPAAVEEDSRPRPKDLPRAYVLFVGGRAAYKNFARLLQAYAGCQAGRELALVVAGKPWRPEEEEEVCRSGLESRIRLIVHPTNVELAELYRRAAALVFPSLHEGFGIPLLEAMACGTPVLAADTEVFREIAGEAAEYFDPLDVVDIGRALASALDPRLRRQMIERGLRQVEQYRWDRTAELTCGTYRRAMEDFYGAVVQAPEYLVPAGKTGNP